MPRPPPLASCPKTRWRAWCSSCAPLCLLGVVTLIGVPFLVLVVPDNVRGFGRRWPAPCAFIVVDERAMRLGAATVLPVSVGLFALWQLVAAVRRIRRRAACSVARRWAACAASPGLRCRRCSRPVRLVMSVVFTLSIRRASACW